MTTTARKTTHSTSGALRAWTTLRTRIQHGAENRTLGHELTPIEVALGDVAPGDSAVIREIRAMLHA